MTSISYFVTENINMAAYLICLGFSMNILRPEYGTRALFEFTECTELLAAIVGYERGNAGAKRLLNTRSRLYQDSSAVVRSGGSNP